MGDNPEIKINNNNFHIRSKELISEPSGLARRRKLIVPDRVIHEAAVDECHELIVPTPPPSRRNSILLQASPQLQQRRKFSFPAALPSSLLSIEPSMMGGSARRRFSNVSDVVSRKLSNTIGWRTVHVPPIEVINQGKSLCSQYIRSRLKRSGYLNKKCSLQRLRSAFSLPGGIIVREVFPELLGLGLELERMHPKVYTNITRQASNVPGGRLASEKDAGSVLTVVSRELLKQDVTWCKIVSLYAVAGGLAVDCAKQGHYEYLTSIIEAMEEILEDELAQWIQDKGGWHALANLVKPPNSRWPAWKVTAFISSIFLVILFLVIILRLLGISNFL